MNTRFMPPSVPVSIGTVATFLHLRELIVVVLLLRHRLLGDVRIGLIHRAAAGRCEHERLGRIGRRHRIEHIMLFADVDLRLLMRHFEMVVADLDHLPERHVRIVAVARQIRRRHAERIGLDLKSLLSAEKRFPRQRIDLADLLVGHGVAAARRAIAVDHQEGAAIAVGLVEGVGEADVDGEVVAGIRIHQAGRDRIEALGRLTIAFLDLRAKATRPAADRIDFQQFVARGGVLLPDFELGFFLEDADEDRQFLRHVFLVEQRQHLRRQFFHRAGGKLIALVAVAAGKRQRTGENRRRHKRADKAGADQCKTPRTDGPTPCHHRIIVILKRWLSQGSPRPARRLLTAAIKNGKFALNLRR